MSAKININYQNASGPIPFNLTNDYMFRMTLQKNVLVLKGLVAALLYLSVDSITSIEITNPFVPGDNYSQKEFILDIRVILNGNTIINLELQVDNKGNWPDRSLSYLCRNYDNVYRGQDYDTALPVIHIGILGFSLFPENPEFYATYKMMNVKNHQIYNDKFTLSVLSLNCINLATEEDKAHHIDYWARLFQAKTWEELRMIAANDPYMNEATKSLYLLNNDERLLEICRAREEYERHERTIQKRFDDLEAKLKAVTAEKAQISAEKAQISAEKAQISAEKDEIISALQEKIRLLEQKHK